MQPVLLFDHLQILFLVILMYFHKIDAGRQPMAQCNGAVGSNVLLPLDYPSCHIGEDDRKRLVAIASRYEGEITGRRRVRCCCNLQTFHRLDIQDVDLFHGGSEIL